MNSDLLNIITTGGGGAETGDDDGVDDILSPRFALNLGRSQSAAPETKTWGYGGKIPSSTKSAHVSTSAADFARFFDENEEEEDREEAGGKITRPASTGVIGRPSGGDDGDMNSILETLGLGPLESSDSQQNNMSSPYSSSGKALGGIDSSGSLVMGAHPPSQKSFIEKIREGTPNFAGENESNNVFSSNQGSQMASQQQQQQQQAYQANQYGLQPQTAAPRQVYQQDPSHYEQQQVYYQHQQQQVPQNNYQDYRAQQQANFMQNSVPQINAGQQQTMYHAPQAASPYGFDYHAQPQQHIPHGIPANHVLMSHQQVGAPMMHGQPQYVSVVPTQGGPHVIAGAPGYAYVQYGSNGMPMNAQPTLVAGGAPVTFMMGPNGPIAVSAAPPGVVTMNTINYSGHGSTPPGAGGRTPPRSGGGMMKTPDRGSGRKKNPMSSPRKRLSDKNASTPSKLGPEASNLLNEIRAAKSLGNQWTIYEIKGHVVEFCLDQNGSRFIQQRLEVADANEKNAVVHEIIPAIKDLQNDVFGNYVVQKLYEFGTDEVKKELKGTLDGNMLSLSLQMYGCRVVQKALESLDYKDLCELLQEFDSYVLTCIQDQNGNHVMQKCIEVMSIKAKEAEAKTGEAGLSSSMADKIQFIVGE